MGIFGNLFSDSSKAVVQADEVVQQELQQTAAKVIQIDENVLKLIPQIIKNVKTLQTDLLKVLQKDPAKFSGSIRLVQNGIDQIVSQLNSILTTRSVSEEYKEIKIIASYWHNWVERLNSDAFKFLRKMDTMDNSQDEDYSGYPEQSVYVEDTNKIAEDLMTLEELIGSKGSLINAELAFVKKDY